MNAVNGAKRKKRDYLYRSRFLFTVARQNAATVFVTPV